MGANILTKMRIYELAKKLNMPSKELIEIVNDKFNLSIKNHMSVIKGEDADTIMNYINEQKKKQETDSNSVSKPLEDSAKVNKDNKDNNEKKDDYKKTSSNNKSNIKTNNNNSNKNNKHFKKNEKTNNKKHGKHENMAQENSNDTQSKAEAEDELKVVEITESLTVGEFAESIKKPVADVIKRLIMMGIMATINNEIDFDTASKVAEQYNIILEKKQIKEREEELINDFEDKEEDLVLRPPVVTVMGHVDHGKTSLLDAIRHSKVASTEAGGITQHIGAYTVDLNKQKIVFLDTPGHEAFTAMRARGAQATDIAVLVVAADDGVMPQTIEAINHAKAAKVPLIVAINKMDKPGANPERVKQELSNVGVVPEDWGGDTICVPVSAKTKEGLDNLLEMILLVAEMQEIKANPKRPAKGIVIEAELDKGRGPVATVLVQKGTLHVGDSIVVGSSYGKVRAMIDDKGRKVKSAGPSIPVAVLGLNDIPNAGDVLYAIADDKTARQISEIRKDKEKQQHFANAGKVSLDDLYDQIQEGKVKELNLIIKADVQGSVEAVKQSMEKLSNEEVKIRTIHGGVGAITENDIELAVASNAIIIGFNIRPDIKAKQLAEKEKVDIRLYRIIYDAINDVTQAMKGLYAPKFEEQVTARLTVRTTFKVSSVGTIAGCYVDEGTVNRNDDVRVIRDSIVIYEGKIGSLKRFKDDVKEVQSGFECGLTVEKFNDIKDSDVIESYTMKEIKRE